jgi:hypothetical protein
MSEQIISFARENALFVAVLLGLVAAFVLLRTKGTPVASVSELDALLSRGQPVLVEFYSNT